MDFALTGCTLIDGTGRDPIANAALHVRDGRIVWVGPTEDMPVEAGQAYQEGASGKTIIVDGVTITIPKKAKKRSAAKKTKKNPIWL